MRAAGWGDAAANGADGDGDAGWHRDGGRFGDTGWRSARQRNITRLEYEDGGAGWGATQWRAPVLPAALMGV